MASGIAHRHISQELNMKKLLHSVSPALALVSILLLVCVASADVCRRGNVAAKAIA